MSLPLHIELCADEETFILLYDEIIRRQRRLPAKEREQLEVLGRQLLSALSEDEETTKIPKKGAEK